MNLYYEEYSGLSKQDTLFLHGNLASHRWWHPTVREWQKAGSLGRGSLILSDWRGCGRNEEWPVDQPFTLEDLAHDQLRLIDRMKLKDVALVGHSLGGLIALQMMILEPGLFSRAVLLDPVSAEGVVFDDSMYEAFKQMSASAELTRNVILSTIFNADGLDEEFKREIAADAFKSVKGIGAAVLQILKAVDLTEAAAKVQAPTLILHGEKDQVLPAAGSEKLSRLLPNAKLETLINQGHCWNVENPQGFTERLRQWL